MVMEVMAESWRVMGDQRGFCVAVGGLHCFRSVSLRHMSLWCLTEAVLGPKEGDEAAGLSREGSGRLEFGRRWGKRSEAGHSETCTGTGK